MDIIVGKPLLPTDYLGFDMGDVPCHYTEERFLPRILVTMGVFRSTGEVKKNRPDLFRTLDKLDMEELKVGKRVIWLLIGD